MPKSILIVSLTATTILPKGYAFKRLFNSVILFDKCVSCVTFLLGFFLTRDCVLVEVVKLEHSNLRIKRKNLRF